MSITERKIRLGNMDIRSRTAQPLLEKKTLNRFLRYFEEDANSRGRTADAAEGLIDAAVTDFAEIIGVLDEHLGYINICEIFAACTDKLLGKKAYFTNTD
jgi:hypothetical protein